MNDAGDRHKTDRDDWHIALDVTLGNDSVSIEGPFDHVSTLFEAWLKARDVARQAAADAAEVNALTGALDKQQDDLKQTVDTHTPAANSGGLTPTP